MTAAQALSLMRLQPTPAGASVALSLVKSACQTALWIALPLVGATAVAGIINSALRYMFQLDDPALGVATRLAAFGLAVFLAAPWIWRHTQAFYALLERAVVGTL